MPPPTIRQTKYGSTALLFAVKHSHTEASTYLVQVGADTSFVDDRGRSLLMWSSYTGNLPLIKLFVDAGLGIKTRDKSGKTAMQVCS